MAETRLQPRMDATKMGNTFEGIQSTCPIYSSRVDRTPKRRVYRFSIEKFVDFKALLKLSIRL